MRSFHYAAFFALLKEGSLRPETFLPGTLGPGLVSLCLVAFLRSYLDEVKEAPFVPKEPAELKTILSVFLLEKTVYELGYELNHRPGWTVVPLRGSRI